MYIHETCNKVSGQIKSINSMKCHVVSLMIGRRATVCPHDPTHKVTSTPTYGTLLPSNAHLNLFIVVLFIIHLCFNSASTQHFRLVYLNKESLHLFPKFTLIKHVDMWET